MPPTSRSLIAFTLASLAVAPAARGQVSVGAGILEHEARPGSEYRQSFAVTNASDDVVRVRLYQRDFTFAAGGHTEFGPPGRASRSNAPWIHLRSTDIEIPPRQSAAVELRISVPRSTATAGSHWSTVMVEQAPVSTRRAGRDGRPAAPEVTMGVRQVMRTAVIVVTHVAGVTKPDLTFEQPRLLSEAGGSVLQFDVVNTGDLAFRPDVTVELYDDEGGLRGRHAGERLMLYPGTSTRQRVALGAVPRGRFTAVVLAEHDGEVLVAGQFRLTF